MRVKCPNGCGVKGSGLISLGRKETQTVSCQTFFHLLVWIGTDELLERFRWEMISVCSCCLTPGHECGCNYTRMVFFLFFGGNNCSQAGGTIRRRGGKTAIDAFLLPPEKNPSAVVSVLRDCSSKQVVRGTESLGVRSEPCVGFFLTLIWCVMAN